MDQETAAYILKYFHEILTVPEQLAVKKTISRFKNNAMSKHDISFPATQTFRDKGWITAEQTIIDLLQEGYDSFEIRVATRILNEHPERVFLNNCPACGRLARTPDANQCRHCGHQWRDVV
ncbi:MAG: hypothetical protein WCR52_19345 [Bacteroidota bacterium]